MNNFDQFVYLATGIRSGHSASDLIESIEKIEQQIAVRNERLPKRSNRSCIPSDLIPKHDPGIDYEEWHQINDKINMDFTRKQYEKMGIEVIEDSDDLFLSVKLPEGWSIAPTDHPMWNEVLDDKGRKRISFFYKGSFCDRDAFSNFICRYGYQIMPFDEYKSDASYDERKFKPWTAYIADSEVRIKQLAQITPTNDREYLSVDEQLAELAKTYLNENYPNWKDFNAYWDD